MPVTFYPGWKPTPAVQPRVRMDDALKDTSVPASADYYTGVSAGMLLNDQLGDCVIAANGHIIEQQTFYGQGAEVTVTDAMALSGYETVGGYVPNDPSTDNGCVIADGLSWLRKTGMAGHKIAAYGEVSVSSMAKVQTAVAEFGAVDIGINLPNSAMDQFNNGKPWDAIRNDGGIDGGHCVVVVGYDASYLYVFTWGTVQKMTPAFWNKYVEEAWPVVSADWVSAVKNVDPEGVDLGTLGQEFTSVTGQPSPFPPSPTPTPPPAPTPTDPDQAFAAVLEAQNALGQAWVDQRHAGYVTKVAAAGRAWLNAKNL